VITEPETGLSRLYVTGRYLKNEAGQMINLHGFAQTYSPFLIRMRGATTMWQDASVIIR